MDSEKWKLMKMAISQAEEGLEEGGIPIGAVVARGNELLDSGHNMRVQLESQVLHAEMMALEDAGPGNYKGATMYSTLMPCWMCAGAILQFRFSKVVVGEDRTFNPGTREFLESHGIEVEVLDLPECYEMLQKFIAEKPELWNEDIGQGEES